VDYRLAPEHPYPAALDDCLGVTKRLLEDGAGLGLDPARIAVTGDSAGGNMAAVAAQTLPGIAHQALVFAVLDLAGTGSPRCPAGSGTSPSPTTVDLYGHLVPEATVRARTALDNAFARARAASLSVGPAHVHPMCTGVAPGPDRRWSEAQKGVSRPVGRVLCARLRGPTVIHLGLPLPAASCGLPASSGGQPSNARAGRLPRLPALLTLLLVGFT
jgi:hypothetical protein